jgi:hypothetical protein
MQMKNWFLIFLVLAMAYLVQQKTNGSKRYAYAPLSLSTKIRL